MLILTTSIMFLCNTLAYPSIITMESLRVPIDGYKDMKELLELKSRILKILESNEPFDVLLESGEIPYPLKRDGLNYTAYILEVIKQAANKINAASKAQIKKITVVKFCSLANNRWMLGSDMDKIVVYFDKDISVEERKNFISVLQRNGVFDIEITWKMITEENPLMDEVDVAIYENGEIVKPLITYIPSRGKAFFREKLFRLWSDGKLSEDEKDMLAELHKMAIIKNASGEKKHLIISEEEKDKKLELLNNLQKKDLVEFITPDCILSKWLETTKGAVIIDIQGKGKQVRHKKQLGLFIKGSDEKEQIINILTSQILPNLKQTKSLLDVGAGDGTLTKAIAGPFKNIWTVEPNSEQIELLKAIRKDVNVVNGVWQETKEAIHEKFDLILCAHVLYHLETEKLDEYIESLTAKLNPGGKLVIILNSTDKTVEGKIAYHDFFKRFCDPSKVSLDPSSIELDLKKKGYSVDKIRINTSVSSPNLEDFLEIGYFLLIEPYNKLEPRINDINNYLSKLRYDGKFELQMPQDILIVENKGEIGKLDSLYQHKKINDVTESSL